MRRNLLQVSVVAAVLAAVVAVAAPAVARPSGSVGTRGLTPLESGILLRLNAIRAEHKLAPLRVNPRLAAAADKHSQDMVARGFFDHNSVSGSFEQRLRRLYGSSGAGRWSAGENILWSSPGLDPKQALDRWMASAPHRANILSSRWREIGVGAVARAGAPGVYGGQDVVVVTTDFGYRG
jgi:uncharacterized protein YkwD